jgi:hypothetical protein
MSAMVTLSISVAATGQAIHKLDEAHHVGEVGPADLLAMTAIDLSSEYLSRRALPRDSSRRSTGEISSE